MSTKQYLEQNVYDAAVERTEIMFQKFDKVYFSISFGKDSSVMLHIALEVAKRLGKLPVHVLLVDLEGQYQSTIKHAQEMFNREDVVGHWVCLPLNLRNAVSMVQPFWTCWDPEEHEKWIRPLPPNPEVVSDIEYFPFFEPHMEFEDFVVEYGKWFAKGVTCACGVGIRTDESLNRFRTIANQRKQRFEGHAWTTRITENVFNAYPIYDWRTEDIWTAVGRYKWPYNHIYDLMHLSGVSIHDARICQPYGDDQRRGLDLFHRLEPESWFKVVQRVTGANFGALYARTALLGFRKMEKPDEHTWRSYSEFLLDTLPKYQQVWFTAKFDNFFAWWEKEHGIAKEDVLDEASPKLEAAKKIPSWRRIARCILTNDVICKSLSYGQTKNQWKKYQALKEEYGE